MVGLAEAKVRSEVARGARMEMGFILDELRRCV